MGDLATGRCGGHAQASRQAKHCAHKGILMLALLLSMGPQTFTSFSPVVPAIAQQEGRTKWQQPDQASEPRKTSPAPA